MRSFLEAEQKRGVRVVLKLGLLTGLVSSGLASGPAGASAQTPPEAGLRQHRIELGETGTAWFEDGFGGLFAIESIRIEPPDTVFEGHDQRLLVKLLEAGEGWTTVIDLPVNPEAARDTARWPRVSLAPQVTPEMAAIYEMAQRTPPSSESYGYRLEATWQSPEPLLAEGVRFELVGPDALGRGWTFWVRTAALPAGSGGASWEWRYVHVW